MRSVIWFVLLFVVAVVAATSLGGNDGIVSFYWGVWRTDLSLNLFVLLFTLACVATVLAIQGVNALISLPRRAQAWRESNRERAAQASLREAFALYFGGRYSRAQKAAQRALQVQGETPALTDDREFTVLGHLVSAGSLHRLQDRNKRDEQLRRTFGAPGRGASAAEEGARLLAAEWALDDRDAARTLELLGELPPGVARRTQALRLKLQAQRLDRQPLEALRTARLLAKHQGFSRDAAQGLLRSLAFEALNGARAADQLRRIWQQFDNSERRDAFIAACAAQHMVGFNGSEEARAWLLPCWERIGELADDECAALAMALVSAREGASIEWLPRLEAAVQALPRDGAVAYAAGMLLNERELWGKARRLLEQAGEDAALTSSMRRNAWVTLAHMAQREDDAERVAECFRQAAEIG